MQEIRNVIELHVAKYKGGLNLYDYSARQYDPALGQFTSMDPLCEKYYHISPYAYCAGNPVKYVDPDGREWKYIRRQDGHIHVVADIRMNNSSDIRNIPDYKLALSNALNNAFSSATNGLVSAEVTYNGNQIPNKVTPELTLYSEKSNEAGRTIANFSTVNMKDSNGNTKSYEIFASDAMHELLHTVNLHHPFEQTDAKDTELMRSNDGLKTTPQTDSDILNNVMNYKSTVINGQKAVGVQSSLTKGQVDYILKQIDLQQVGAGSKGINDPYWQNQ